MRRLKGSQATLALQKMCEVYASLDSYQDRGYVDSKTGRNDPERIEFKTWFKRPDHFRFDWRDKRSKDLEYPNALWCEGAEILLYESLPSTIKRLPNFEFAIGSVCGVMCFALEKVPRMILKDLQGSNLSNLKKVHSHGTQDFDGVKCIRAVGLGRGKEECKLWISEDDYLLRKLVETREHRAEEGPLLEQEMKRVMDQTIRMFQENAESIPPEIGNAERFFENIKKIPDLKGPYHDFTSKDIEVHLDIKVDQNIPQNSFSFEPPKGVREFGLFDFDWDANQQKLR